MKSKLLKILQKIKRYDIIIFYGLLFAVFGYLIVKNLLIVNDYEKFNEFEAKKNKVEQIQNKENKDTDNDGLLDWQEVLYKTDFENPDTDSDGVLDGEEVKDGTDPTSVKNDRNDEIEVVKESIENIESQIARRQTTVKKSIDVEAYIRSLSIKPSLTNKEKVVLNDYNKDKELIKDDLNNFGRIFISYKNEINNFEYQDLLSGLFGNISVINTKNFDKNEFVGKLKNLESVNKLVENLLERINGEKALSVGFQDYIYELRYSYGNLYKSLQNLQNIYDNKNEEEENIKQVVEMYISSLLDIAESHHLIKKMIGYRKIKIKSGEPASYFNLET